MAQSTLIRIEPQMSDFDAFASPFPSPFWACPAAGLVVQSSLMKIDPQISDFASDFEAFASPFPSPF